MTRSNVDGQLFIEGTAEHHWLIDSRWGRYSCNNCAIEGWWNGMMRRIDTSIDVCYPQ